MRKRIYYYQAIVVIFVSLLSSCMSTEETNYMQTLNLSYPKQDYKEYKLAIGDEVQCAIYTKNIEFSAIFNKVVGTTSESVNANAYVIHHNGTILLPFFGEVKVVGLTLQQAEDVIQDLMQGSITDAQVSLELKNNFFYVISDRGNMRGKHDIYKENLTIFQALAYMNQGTGGANQRTIDLTSVNILRKAPDGTTIRKTFDLRTKDVIQSEYYFVQPNDVYYFPTSKNSFFNITSLSTFFTTIMAPLTFLIVVSRVDFK